MRKLYRRMTMGGGLAVIGVAVAATAPGTSAPTHAPALAHTPSFLAGLPPASLGGPCLSSGKAYLRARIQGAVRLDVDLHGRALTCEGEPRLDGSGIRMGFEGRVGSAGRVRMIFGIDGAREGRPGRELPTNLTVIFEDAKVLFATQGNGNCTVDRLTQERMGSEVAPTRSAAKSAPTHAHSTTSAAGSARPRAYRVVAHGFCIAPANDLSGQRRILVTTFDFAGRAEFNTP